MSFNLQTPQGINEARHEIKAILQLIENYIVLVKTLFKLLRLKHSSYFAWYRAGLDIKAIQYYIHFIENTQIMFSIEVLKMAIKNKDWNTFNSERAHLYCLIKKDLQDIRLLSKIRGVITKHLGEEEKEGSLYSQSILEQIHHLLQKNFKVRDFPKLSVLLKSLYTHYILREENLKFEDKSAQLWHNIPHLHLGLITIFSLVLGYYFVYLYLFEINKIYLINEVITPQNSIYIATVLGVEFILLPLIFYAIFSFSASNILNDKYIQPYFKPLTFRHFVAFGLIPPLMAVLIYAYLLFIFNQALFDYQESYWGFLIGNEILWGHWAILSIVFLMKLDFIPLKQKLKSEKIIKLLCLIVGIVGLFFWLGNMDIKNSSLVFKVGLADRESRLYLINEEFVKRHYLNNNNPPLFYGKIIVRGKDMVVFEYQEHYLEIPKSDIHPFQGYAN